MQSLTQAQHETFEKFKDCASELTGANEIMAFAIGFKLSVRLAFETMISISDITDPKMNKNSNPLHLEADAMSLFEIVQ